MPLKWPEKLKGLALNGAEEVTSRSTVYSAIEAIKNSDDADHNYKEFSIRLDPDSQVDYVWRTK